MFGDDICLSAALFRPSDVRISKVKVDLLRINNAV
jgi:hypothetical protein